MSVGVCTFDRSHRVVMNCSRLGREEGNPGESVRVGVDGGDGYPVLFNDVEGVEHLITLAAC
jgi:hypothetical protein